MSSTVTELELLPSDAISVVHSNRSRNSTDIRPETSISHSVTEAQTVNPPRKATAIAILAQLTIVTGLGSFTNGFITVTLPQMGLDLSLPQNLLFWPTSVNFLTGGALTLLSGAIADIIGSRAIFLLGCLVEGCFTLSVGFAKTGNELIVFRAMMGIGLAMTLPTAIGLLTNSFPAGKGRNIGFAFLGLIQPLGYSLGLVLGGILQDTIGWRSGWYLSGGTILASGLLGIWILPKDNVGNGRKWLNLRTRVDWTGAMIISIALALLSYVLAMVTSSSDEIRRPINLVLLAISVLLLPTFVFWMHRQERLQRPALIPNAIWKNKAFATTCIMIPLTYAVCQVMELLSSLFFQQIQGNSALQASLRLLPAMILGSMANLVTGSLVHRVSAIKLILFSSILAAGSPLLMAVIHPEWPYWYEAFPAQLLEPLSVDVLFTVGMLVVSNSFSEKTQALAGAVFNTVAQFGNTIGLALVAVTTTSVTQNSMYTDKSSPEALMIGYRAGFWLTFAWMILACLVGALGLRSVGKVGLKRE